MPSSPSIPVRAIVREVSRTFANCIRPSPIPIDVERAREEHAGYVASLRQLGVDVVVLPALDDHPDAVYVEDTAVLTGTHAVMTNPGAEARRAEVESIARALDPHAEVGQVGDSANLDGGDVMRAGQRLFVGLSTRTDRAGLRALAGAARRDGLDVMGIEVRAGLHLKSACTVLDDHTLLYAADRFDLRPFEDLGFELIEVPEVLGANVLAFGRDVLVSADAPKTADLIEQRGHTVHRVKIDQFHRGDGALSCLSLRFAPAGKWTV